MRVRSRDVPWDTLGTVSSCDDQGAGNLAFCLYGASLLRGFIARRLCNRFVFNLLIQKLQGCTCCLDML